MIRDNRNMFYFDKVDDNLQKLNKALMELNELNSKSKVRRSQLTVFDGFLYNVLNDGLIDDWTKDDLTKLYKSTIGTNLIFDDTFIVNIVRYTPTIIDRWIKQNINLSVFGDDLSSEFQDLADGIQLLTTVIKEYIYDLKSGYIENINV